MTTVIDNSLILSSFEESLSAEVSDLPIVLAICIGLNPIEIGNRTIVSNSVKLAIVIPEDLDSNDAII